MMPTSISLLQCGILFTVGIFAGAGWTLGAWLVSRVLR